MLELIRDYFIPDINIRRAPNVFNSSTSAILA
jgi:hypothetical protein